MMIGEVEGLGLKQGKSVVGPQIRQAQEHRLEEQLTHAAMIVWMWEGGVG